MRLPRSIREVRALGVSAVFAVAGLGYTGATLVMARVLSAEKLTAAIVIIGLCNLFAATAAEGLNGVVVQRSLRSDGRLLAASVLTALVAATLASSIGYWAYGISGTAAAVLFAAVLAGGPTLAAVSGV